MSTAQLEPRHSPAGPESSAADAARAVWQPRYIRRLRGGDLVAVALAVATAQRLRFGEHGTALFYWNVDYTFVSAVIAATWLAVLSINRSRSPRIVGAGTEEYRRVWNATLAVFGAVAITSMIFRLDIARGYLALALPLGMAFLFLNRYWARRQLLRRRLAGEYQSDVLAVGELKAVRTLTESLSRDPADGYRVVGVCVAGGQRVDSLDVPGLGPVPVYGDENDIATAIALSGADTVALTATESFGPQGIRDLSWELEKLNVDLVVSPGFVDVATPRVVMRPVAGLPLIHVEKPQYSGSKRIEKQAFDVCFAMLMLLCAAPVMIASAIAIKLTSRGPIFYLSERIGIDGNPFRMIKFRTMVVNADQQIDKLKALNESDGGVLFKMREDPRITSVGKYLRRYSIDELPQFFNVLRREMSVVGPRPPLRREVASYDDQIRRRLLVLPGITGLWQISGRSDLSWEDSVRLDLSYVENWSLIGDLLITLRTSKAILMGSGAY